MPTWFGEKGLIMTQTLRGGNPPKYSFNIPKGLSMKRFVIFMTVWLMGLGGLLAGAVIPSSASVQAPATAATSPILGLYTPLTPARVFNGTATTTARRVQIAGLGGVPASATAVMVNTMVLAPTASGYVRVTPAGLNPNIAVQQFTKGHAISNLSVVKLVGGKIQVKVSAGSARILMDVSGYFSANAGAYFTPLAPARVFYGTATTTARRVQIAGLGGVPANATSVMVNTEVLAPTASGYVRVTPAGLNPNIAVQQFTKGHAISNLSVVKLVGGKIQVKVSAGSARILMDVSGYYSANAGAYFTPLAPARVFNGTATTTARRVQIAGLGGVPANATAVILNAGVYAPTAAGYVRVTAAGLNPNVSMQEFAKGQAISNLVAVKLVGGKIQLKVSAGSARIVMDVSGYYRAKAPLSVTPPGPVTVIPVPPVGTLPGPVVVPVPPVGTLPGPVVVPVPPVGTLPGPVVVPVPPVGTLPGPVTGGTTAVLSFSSDGVATTRIPVGASLFFDASGSFAPAGVTPKTAVLDYGDGTAPSSFTGEPVYWWETHSYLVAGTYTVTLTVTDSANVTVSKVATVAVSPAPTAAITIEGNPTSVQAGMPVTFNLSSSTPPGTAITKWTLYGDWLDGGYGTLPKATVIHTFDTPGTYTVHFDFSNDAMGLAQSSIEVTVQ
jgi:FlaG/FlaF family flagellin (archaellin)